MKYLILVAFEQNGWATENLGQIVKQTQSFVGRDVGQMELVVDCEINYAGLTIPDFFGPFDGGGLGLTIQLMYMFFWPHSKMGVRLQLLIGLWPNYQGEEGVARRSNFQQVRGKRSILMK